MDLVLLGPDYLDSREHRQRRSHRGAGFIYVQYVIITCHTAQTHLYIVQSNVRSSCSDPFLDTTPLH